MSTRWALFLGLIILVTAIVMAMTAQMPEKTPGGARWTPDTPTPNQKVPDVVAKDAPVVIAFRGDLAAGGNKEPDGTVIPFVIGDLLTLAADATNAVEYRWTVNGVPLKEKDQEWSKRQDREFEVKKAGELRFALQVRGADPSQLSQPKEVLVKTVALHIESFSASLLEEDDRCLTGEEYTLEVSMTEPLTADLEFYQFRFWVNDEIVKNPEDDEEWSTESDFTYTFPSPGQYSFKVEVRRATEKEAEGSATLAEVIVVADAIVLSFDAYPDKHVPLGGKVDLDAFPDSIFGKPEARFGVKKITDADFKWLPEKDGAIWGEAHRDWMPTEPGNYILRCEVRETGNEKADDSRELLFTVTDTDF